MRLPRDIEHIILFMAQPQLESMTQLQIAFAATRNYRPYFQHVRGTGQTNMVPFPEWFSLQTRQIVLKRLALIELIASRYLAPHRTILLTELDDLPHIWTPILPLHYEVVEFYIANMAFTIVQDLSLFEDEGDD